MWTKPSKAWQGGSTWQSRKKRATVLARDGYTCQLRLEGCTHRATQEHHTLGKGVSEALEHSVAACASCNLKVGDPRVTDPRPTRRTQW